MGIQRRTCPHKPPTPKTPRPGLSEEPSVTSRLRGTANRRVPSSSPVQFSGRPQPVGGVQVAAPHRRAAGLRLDHGSVRDSAGKPVLAERRAAQPRLTDFSLSLVSRPSLSPRLPLPVSVRSWPPPSRGSLSPLGRAGLSVPACASPLLPAL